MQLDLSISYDIKFILRLPEHFNVGVLRTIIPHMIYAIYPQSRSLSDIVSSSGHSMRTIEREFKENIGCGPSKFFNILQIGVCGALLLWHHELSIDGIALACGFGTSDTFRRQFRQLTGINPSCFRETVKRGEPTPTVIAGRIKAVWDVPKDIKYDMTGSICTPIIFKISIEDMVRMR